MQAEKNLQLFLNMHVVKAEKEGDRITAVVARHIADNRELQFRGQLFADYTGDGNLGFLAGADFRVGREARNETGESRAPEKADRLMMGTSVQWYSVNEDKPYPFPDCPWAVQFNERSCQQVTRGNWDWETGMIGEVVGIASSLCKKHACNPRDVYAGHLEEFKKLLRKGVPYPATAIAPNQTNADNDK